MDPCFRASYVLDCDGRDTQSVSDFQGLEKVLLATGALVNFLSAASHTESALT